MKAGNVYIDKNEFYQEFLKYKNKSDNKASDKLASILFSLANNISTSKNFRCYTWRKDMIQDAMLRCLISLDKFDIEKHNNPFGYFTTVIWREFIVTIGREKRQLMYKMNDDVYEKYGDHRIIPPIEEQGSEVVKQLEKYNKRLAEIIENKNNYIKLFKNRVRIRKKLIEGLKVQYEKKPETRRREINSVAVIHNKKIATAIRHKMYHLEMEKKERIKIANLMKNYKDIFNEWLYNWVE
jgi:DNA-directed RNA polymerase specialized sigma24 family protein